MLLSASALAWAQGSSELSADLPDARTLAVQAKVEQLFQAEEFRRAYFIYRNELAPIGDKYAQYMVGYMSLNGLGVSEDPVSASAWYRLAAERETPEFVAVSNHLLRQLDEDQVQQSNAEYFRLRSKYSDVAVVLASIKRNLSELEGRTGSRIRSDSSPITIVEPDAGRAQSADNYYGSIYRQLEERLLLLKEMDGFHDIDTDPARFDIRELERRAQVRIESIN
jgi:TPR repeat protein